MFRYKTQKFLKKRVGLLVISFITLTLLLSIKFLPSFLIYTPLAFLVPIEESITYNGPDEYLHYVRSFDNYVPDILPVTNQSKAQEILYLQSKTVFQFQVTKALNHAKNHRSPINPKIVVKTIMINYTVNYRIVNKENYNLNSILIYRPWSWIHKTKNGSFIYHSSLNQNRTVAIQAITPYYESIPVTGLMVVRQYWYSVAEGKFAFVFDRLIIADLNGTAYLELILLLSLCGLWYSS